MEYVFHNIMEDVVEKKLEEIVETLGCCTCEKCRLDIASYALNRLPPKYVVTLQGELLCKLDTEEYQFEMDVVSLIVQAAQIIKQHPHH